MIRDRAAERAQARRQEQIDARRREQVEARHRQEADERRERERLAEREERRRRDQRDQDLQRAREQERHQQRIAAARQRSNERRRQLLRTPARRPTIRIDTTLQSTTKSQMPRPATRDNARSAHDAARAPRQAARRQQPAAVRPRVTPARTARTAPAPRARSTSAPTRVRVPLSPRGGPVARAAQPGRGQPARREPLPPLDGQVQRRPLSQRNGQAVRRAPLPPRDGTVSPRASRRTDLRKPVAALGNKPSPSRNSISKPKQPARGSNSVSPRTTRPARSTAAPGTALNKLRSPTLREVVQTQERVTVNQQARVRDRAVLQTTAQPRLAARIPSGHLSNGLPWLKVERNGVVNAETDRPVLLRGLNRSGLEYAEPTVRGFLDAAGISRDQIREIAENWGANIIRLPFNQDWALNGRAGFPAVEYLDGLDQVIYWASSFGVYTLLDLQWLDADTNFGGTNRVAPLPNLDSILLWGILANRYRLEPAVLYDVFNEPHSPLPDDPNPLEGIDETGITFPLTTRVVTMREWQPWARQLVSAIRRAHTNALVFVSGVDWAYDLRGMPLTIARGRPEVFANVVYSTHVYPRKGPESTSSGTEPLPGPVQGPSWYQAFGHFASQVPIFAGEWGVDEGQEDVDTQRLWAERLGQYFSSLGLGWTAWSWSDRPRLTRALPVLPAEPTRYGQVVRYFLGQP